MISSGVSSKSGAIHIFPFNAPNLRSAPLCGTRSRYGLPALGNDHPLSLPGQLAKLGKLCLRCMHVDLHWSTPTQLSLAKFNPYARFPQPRAYLPFHDKEQSGLDVKDIGPRSVPAQSPSGFLASNKNLAAWNPRSSPESSRSCSASRYLRCVFTVNPENPDSDIRASL